MDMKMKCLKVEEFFNRTASLKDTNVLLKELESYVKSGPSLQDRCCTLYDRVIRACCNRLGAVGQYPDIKHIDLLIKVVELALGGYSVSGEHHAKDSPLYMEKIVYHIFKKLGSLGVHSLCSRLGNWLYSRLVQQTEDSCALVQSCFGVLWNGMSAAEAETSLKPREDKLHYKMQALSFLLLFGRESTVPPSYSKVPVYTEQAFTEFQKGCKALTKNDASFLLQEVRHLFHGCMTACQSREGDIRHSFVQNSLLILSEVVLATAKLLCKESHWDLASVLLNELECEVKRNGDLHDLHGTIVALGKWAVKMYCSRSSGEEIGQGFTKCARALRHIPADLGDRESRAVLEASSLVQWAVEAGQPGVLNGPDLLAWFSFLEEHQERILRRLQMNSASQTEVSQLEQSLFLSMNKSLDFARESLLASQLKNTVTLNRVALYCQATAGRMMTELRKPDSNVYNEAMAASTIYNLGCVLYNQQHYDQAFPLIEIVCQELCRNCLASISLSLLNKVFTLGVRISQRTERLHRALDLVISWLKALGPNLKVHMVEPVSLWAKTKASAVCDDEDIKLRTLRDGFGADIPDEEVMLCLLEEELRMYKEMIGDTTQQRYNTLCDLLDICHEESPRTHLRAVYLCEMAQVVCFQDFSEQTDCSAVDFTHEALRLLGEERKTAENAHKLKDDQAHALLWLYICTLENNLQKAIEKGKRLKDLCQETDSVMKSIPVNDLDYEDSQKQQDGSLIHEGLHFNLESQSKLSQFLEKALDKWSSVLQKGSLPSVRNLRQTCSSLLLTTALFKLMGKPLKALKASQLAFGVCHHLPDDPKTASYLCQSAMLLLEMGVPEMAQAQLQQAENILASDTTSDGPSHVFMMVVLLKARHCYATGQVEPGVQYLCEVLKEATEKQSKSWYLLKAQALKTCGSYLTLDTTDLPQELRKRIAQHGSSNAEIAFSASLRLLQSLLCNVVGNNMGNNILSYSKNADGSVPFINQGDNLLLKWQVLSEMLDCYLKVVDITGTSGGVHHALQQCVQALELATKLQALSKCAELLVMKAELELMRGKIEESGFDLDRVRSLLEPGKDFSCLEQKANVKIKPRKGCPAQKSQSQSPTSSFKDEVAELLKIRWPSKQPIEMVDQGSSPPFKAQARRWLSSFTHETNCLCPCCSEPSLGRVSALWAVAEAQLCVQQDFVPVRVGHKFHQATLARCKRVTARLKANLITLCGRSSGCTEPSWMQDVVGRTYLHMALSELEPKQDKGRDIWNTLEAGLAFVSDKPSLDLKPFKAGLMATKAVAALLTLAAKSDCTPEEVFSKAWTWNPSKLKLKPKTLCPPQSQKTKQPVVPEKDPAILAKTGKEKLPKTPMIVQPSKFSFEDFTCFDFKQEVPTLTCKTPAQKVKLPPFKTTTKAKPKPEFSVYEESSPVPPRPVVHAKTGKAKKPVAKTELAGASSSGKAMVLQTPKVVKVQFEFDTEVPKLHLCTSVKKAEAPASARKRATKVKPKPPLFSDEDTSPVQDTAQCVPAAPRRTRKPRFQVEFSDESDSDAEPQAETVEVHKGRAATARAPHKKVPDPRSERAPSKRQPKYKWTSDESDLEPNPQVEKREVPTGRTTTTKASHKTVQEPRDPPKRQARVKKTTALSVCFTSDEDVETVSKPAPVRRGRPRRQLGPTADHEPGKMMAIEEVVEGLLDISIEQLMASDTETEKDADAVVAGLQDMSIEQLMASDTEKDADAVGGFEVLRKDLLPDKGRDHLFELHRRAPPGAGSFSYSDPGLDNISMETIQSLLRSAILAVQHYPPPALYPRLCWLLALTLGQQDPITTAMLHTQSLGVTSRHSMVRHLTSCLRKLRKKEAASDLVEKMESLSVSDPSAQTVPPLEQTLSQLEKIFSFSDAGASAFPQHHCQEFTQQLKDLPSGVTVCVLSVVGVKPGEMGDTILLSRLEKGSSPVTVHIPTSQQKHPISSLVQELHDIKKETASQTKLDKAAWWSGRREIDARVERLLEDMEELLGCWRGLLLPLTSDPELSVQVKNVHKALGAHGVTASEEMLKAVLSASPLLSQGDQESFAMGECPQKGEEVASLLRAAVSRLRCRDEPEGHVVLILDKYLQQLPWESISCLSPCSVSRMPSLEFVLGHCVRNQRTPTHGVDATKVFYLLNPSGDLVATEEQFKPLFSSMKNWEGVCGVAPDVDQMQEAITSKDLYIYMGHGAGATYLGPQSILKEEMRAAALLFGCSSGALAVRGEMEGEGIILNYLLAGCPFVLGNLWDVTDREINRFAKALLVPWLSAGPGSPLLEHMEEARQATTLKSLTGAAPVVYGLPIHLL